MENQNAGGGHQVKIQIRRSIDQGPHRPGASRATQQRSIQTITAKLPG